MYLNVKVPVFVAFALLFAADGFGQQLESEPPPAGEAKPAPYLSSGAVDYRSLLSAPPALDTIDDRIDHRAIDELQKVDEARRKSAEIDARLLYPRFADAFGGPIDRRSSPALVSMLNRAMRDVSQVGSEAKDHFHRPRPFQRFQLEHVCGSSTPSKPEVNPTVGTSYPSGHSSYGWSVAMILARVAPERAEALLARAREYADSRLICGFHFPSDVQAGEVVATAVVARLDQDPGFQADLARVRAERAGARPAAGVAR
jgi:acid phosphatase (class A)